MFLMSCENDSSTTPNEEPIIGIGGTVYFLNTKGDVGTISKLEESIENDVATTGKWSNGIKYFDNKLFVVNSGNSNISVFDKETLVSLKSIELTEGINPMEMVLANDKIYVSSLFGSGIEIRKYDDNSLVKTLSLGSSNGGLDAIFADSEYVYVNRNNYQWVGGVSEYNDEYVFKIDTKTDMVVDSVLCGINVYQIVKDNNNRLHVVCKGDYKEQKGSIKIVDLDTFEVIKSMDTGSAPGNVAINSKGIAYAAISGMKEDYSGFGGIMSYDTNTLEIIHGEDDLIYDSPTSGFLGICVDRKDNVYAPSFDENLLYVFDSNADTLKTKLVTGDGPQGAIFISDKE